MSSFLEGGGVTTKLLAELDMYAEMRGCQMVYIYTKNSNLGIFSRVLEWKILLHFYRNLEHRYILLPFGIFYAHLVSLWTCGIFFLFGILYQEKSGNPAGMNERE
jgi:hypothetical protein